MTDEDTLRAMPSPPDPPESLAPVPRWAPLLVILVAGMGVAAFVVGLPPITYAHDPTPQTCVDNGRVCTDVDGTDTVYIECGSVFLPNLVSTGDIGECEGALLVRRITIGLLASAAILLALLGAKKSGSVGREHTRAWDEFLVGGAFAAFLAVWMLAAGVITAVGAWEPS
jgi:hypothetical protein